MSKGLGKTQNKILDHLRWEGKLLTLAEITNFVYLCVNTVAHRTATRRALMGLKQHGLVELEKKYPHRWKAKALAKVVRPKFVHPQQIELPFIGGAVNTPGGGLWSQT